MHPLRRDGGGAIGGRGADPGFERLAGVPVPVRSGAFLRRYWNGEPLKELEQAYGLTHSALAKRMYRLRGSLRKTLEREGYTL